MYAKIASHWSHETFKSRNPVLEIAYFKKVMQLTVVLRAAISECVDWFHVELHYSRILALGLQHLSETLQLQITINQVLHSVVAQFETNVDTLMIHDVSCISYIGLITVSKDY